MQMDHLPPHQAKIQGRVIQGHAEASSNNSFFQTYIPDGRLCGNIQCHHFHSPGSDFGL